MCDDRKIAKKHNISIECNPSQKRFYRILSQGKSSRFTDVGDAAAERRVAEVHNARWVWLRLERHIHFEISLRDVPCHLRHIPELEGPEALSATFWCSGWGIKPSNCQAITSDKAVVSNLTRVSNSALLNFTSHFPRCLSPQPRRHEKNAYLRYEEKEPVRMSKTPGTLPQGFFLPGTQNV